MEIKACLFDLDGVIVDTAKYHYSAWKELARGLGFDFAERDNERLKGVSRMTSLDILLEVGGIQLDDETKIKYADQKNKRYVEYILKMTEGEILPGVINLLEELKSENILIGLGSASKNAMTILEQTKLTKYFDTVVDGTKVSNAKPDPEVFIKGAENLGINPENCIVFEDAEAGIEAANIGGFKSVGIGKPEVLKHANIVLPGFAKVSFDMILEQLKKSNA